MRTIVLQFELNRLANNYIVVNEMLHEETLSKTEYLYVVSDMVACFNVYLTSLKYKNMINDEELAYINKAMYHIDNNLREV